MQDSSEINTHPEDVSNLELNKEITYKDAVKKILVMTSATVPLQIIKTAFPIINSIILSHRSVPIQESAILINSLIDLSYNVMNSPLYYVQTSVGKLNGDPKKQKEIGSATQAGWVVAIGVSTLQIVLLLLSEKILNTIGEDPAITKLVQRFFNLYVVSVPMLSLQLVTDQMALSTDQIYFPVVIQGVALLGYGACAYPLTFGKWGAMNLGIDGASLAMITRGLIYTLFSFGGIAILSLPRRMFSKYRLLYIERNEIFANIKELSVKGIPLFLIISSEIGIMYINNMLITRASSNFLTPQLIISQYQDFLVVFVSAFATAAQKEISNSMAKHKQNIRRLGNVSIGLSSVIPLLYLAMVLINIDLLMKPFINPNDERNKETVQIIKNNRLFLISGLCNLLLNIRYVTTQALIGTGKMDAALLICMLLAWSGIAVGVLLNLVFKMDAILSFNIGLAVGFLISGFAQVVNWIFKSSLASLNASPGKLKKAADSFPSERTALLDDQNDKLEVKTLENRKDESQSSFSFTSCLTRKSSPTMFSPAKLDLLDNDQPPSNAQSFQDYSEMKPPKSFCSLF